MRIRRLFGAIVAAAAIVAAVVGASGPAQAKQDCQVQDVSGEWVGNFTSQVFGDGFVDLHITQDHRRFHVTADATDAAVVQGDGTIAASGQSHFNGSGDTIKKINAKGTVQGTCETTTAEFSYDATYVTGQQDSGTVTLTHLVGGGGT